MSGSGKSSVAALLLRYYDPVRGNITFDGQDIREFDVNSWRSVIGVVPQDPVMFTGTIAENIAYGCPEATRTQIEQAARDANCEFVWGMPDGFDTKSAFIYPSAFIIRSSYRSFYVRSR